MPVKFKPQDNLFDQSTGDKLDYQIDWTNALPEGDEITSSTWTDDSGVLTLTGSTFSTLQTVIWVEGVIAGTTHKITNEIETVGGRRLTDSIYIYGRNK